MVWEHFDHSNMMLNENIEQDFEFPQLKLKQNNKNNHNNNFFI